MRATPQVFMVRAGGHGEDEETALGQGLALVGFEDVPSLEAANDAKAVASLVKAAHPQASVGKLRSLNSQLRIFRLDIRPGDTIVLPRKFTSQIALGVVKEGYGYRNVAGKPRHTLLVDWVRTDVPRTAFEQDLLFSFGAFMTVCRITRHHAEARIAAVLAGKRDPGPVGVGPATKPSDASTAEDPEDAALQDVAQFAHDQIVQHVQARFAGHALSSLVEAVLLAEGWVTNNSPPGADGGVDILAGRGFLGLDSPRLCVQVKSQPDPVDVTVYRNLQGVMQSFSADQGLLVCWGGFKSSVLREARQAHFSVRLWDSSDLIRAVYRHYERLPAEIQAELPLKRVWMLVPEGEDA